MRGNEKKSPFAVKGLLDLPLSEDGWQRTPGDVGRKGRFI
jgi:hypothetical protein